jgi:hypothetical protein
VWSLRLAPTQQSPQSSSQSCPHLPVRINPKIQPEVTAIFCLLARDDSGMATPAGDNLNCRRLSPRGAPKSDHQDRRHSRVAPADFLVESQRICVILGLSPGQNFSFERRFSEEKVAAPANFLGIDGHFQAVSGSFRCARGFSARFWAGCAKLFASEALSPARI